MQARGPPVAGRLLEKNFQRSLSSGNRRISWALDLVRGVLLAKGPDSSLGEVHSGSCSGNIHMEEEKGRSQSSVG